MIRKEKKRRLSRVGKKIVSCVASIALAASLTPAVALTAYADEGGAAEVGSTEEVGYAVRENGPITMTSEGLTSAPLTIEARFKVEDDGRSVIYGNYGANGKTVLNVELTAQARPRIYFTRSTSIVFTTIVVPKNKWTNLAFSLSINQDEEAASKTGTLSCYLNGNEKIESKTLSAEQVDQYLSSGKTPFVIGGDYRNDPQSIQFRGNISGIATYSTTLSGEQIKDNSDAGLSYFSDLTSDTENLLMGYTLDSNGLVVKKGPDKETSTLTLDPTKIPDSNSNWINAEENDVCKVDYIHFTHGVDTKAPWNSNSGFKVSFRSHSEATGSDGDYGAILGARTSSKQSDFQLTTYNGGFVRYGSSEYKTTLTNTERFCVSANAETHAVYRNEEKLADLNAGLLSEFQAGGTLAIGALNNNGSITQGGKGCDIFSLDIYYENALVYSFTPAIYSKGGSVLVGLYDSKTKHFLNCPDTTYARTAGLGMETGKDLSMHAFIETTASATDNLQVGFKLNGSLEELVSAEEAAEGLQDFAFTNIPPQHMSDTITATLYVNGTEYWSKETSVKKYCETIVNGGYSEKFQTLAKDILHYGSAAQKYRDYKTDSLADSGISGGSEYVEPTGAAAVKSEVSNGATISLEGYGVRFDYVNNIVLKVKDSSEQKTGIVKVYEGTISEENLKATVSLSDLVAADDVYTVVTPAISATKFDTEYTIALYSNASDTVPAQTLKYSVVAFVKNVLSKESYSSQLKELAKNLYCYGIGAKAALQQ